jgi:hypothetical protein
MMNNGPPRIHPGKDVRTIQNHIADPQHRHHRLMGSSVPLQAQLQSALPAPEAYNFPPDSVEATEIILRNRPRLTARDAAGMKVLISLKLN